MWVYSSISVPTDKLFLWLLVLFLFIFLSFVHFHIQHRANCCLCVFYHGYFNPSGPFASALIKHEEPFHSPMGIITDMQLITG